MTSGHATQPRFSPLRDVPSSLVRSGLIRSVLMIPACAVMTMTLTAAPVQDAPKPTTPDNAPAIRLRAPWVDRARDLGVLSPDAIRVLTDGERLEAVRLLERVVQVRSIITTMLGPFELRRPDAPKLMVFEDLGEMRFTLRTSLGDKGPKVTSRAIQHSDGTALAVTTQVNSPRNSERVFQAEAFRQYMLPRLPANFPLWAEIGLSEFFGAILINKGGWDAGHVPPEFALVLEQAQQQGRLIPLEALIRLDSEALARTERATGTELLRAEAWSLVHFLLTGGTPELASRFTLWLHKAASGQDSFVAFESVFTQMPGGASMAALESAWQRSIESLGPSPVLQSLQQAELLRAVLEDLEHDGVRPDSPVDLQAIVEARPAVEHELAAHPDRLVLSSRTPGAIDPTKLVFSPNPVRPSIRNTATSESPPRVRFLDSGDWSIQIDWSWDAAGECWQPQVVAMPSN